MLGLSLGLNCNLFNTPILNQISGTVAAYSLRKLKSGVQYPIRVRRTSDNTETDIGFIGTNLDTVSLLSFCGSGSGYITKWYDQSGNGNHAIQNTTSNQPRIVNTGVLEVDSNNRPAIYFDGSNYRLPVGNINQSAYAASIVFNPSNTINSATTTNELNINWNGTTGGIRTGSFTASLTNEIVTISSSGSERNGWTSASDSISANSNHLLATYWDGSKYNIVFDGTSKTITTFGTPILINTDNLILGVTGDLSSTNHFQGKMFEYIHFGATTTSSSISKLKDNQSKYYNITVT